MSRRARRHRLKPRLGFSLKSCGRCARAADATPSSVFSIAGGVFAETLDMELRPLPHLDSIVWWVCMYAGPL